MSLNRYESMLLDYLEARPEEKAFWQRRILELDRRQSSRIQLAQVLEGELWAYFEERGRHEYPFREVFIHEGPAKVSLINLAEYLFRMWTPVRPARPGRQS
ncbi:MAG: hypothetical protein EA425_13115 [Puniceicoccaceae bacterium]|nr:MAG: hypothetical protein EA425_13115 [Puniceicoccaceae bacterium]